MARHGAEELEILQYPYPQAAPRLTKGGTTCDQFLPHGFQGRAMDQQRHGGQPEVTLIQRHPVILLGYYGCVVTGLLWLLQAGCLSASATTYSQHLDVNRYAWC